MYYNEPTLGRNSKGRPISFALTKFRIKLCKRFKGVKYLYVESIESNFLQKFNKLPNLCYAKRNNLIFNLGILAKMAVNDNFLIQENKLPMTKSICKKCIVLTKFYFNK